MKNDIVLVFDIETTSKAQHLHQMPIDTQRIFLAETYLRQPKFEWHSNLLQDWEQIVRGENHDALHKQLEEFLSRNRHNDSIESPQQCWERVAAFDTRFSRLICISFAFFSLKHGQFLRSGFNSKKSHWVMGEAVDLTFPADEVFHSFLVNPLEKDEKGRPIKISRQEVACISALHSAINECNKVSGYSIGDFDIPYVAQKYLEHMKNGYVHPKFKAIWNAKVWEREADMLDTKFLAYPLFGKYVKLSRVLDLFGIGKKTMNNQTLSADYWKAWSQAKEEENEAIFTNFLTEVVHYCENDVRVEGLAMKAVWNATKLRKF